MELKEAYSKIESKILHDLSGQSWLKAIIDVERYEKSAKFYGKYIDGSGSERDLEASFGFAELKAISRIHELTSQDRNWNRAKFTKTPNGEMGKEFFWDQEIQDKIDANKTGKP